MVFSQTLPHAALSGKVAPARSSKAPAGIALGVNRVRKPSRDANAPIPLEGKEDRQNELAQNEGQP